MDSYNYVSSFYLLNNRHYHNINHINAMIKAVYLYGDPDKCLKSYFRDGSFAYVGLHKNLYDAILFHDIIYDIPNKLGSSNEELSAREYECFADVSRISPSDKRSTADMIRATEHHFDGTVYNDYLTNLLLDVDIVGLAAEWDGFLVDAKNVALEYMAHYPKTYVLNCRKQFLQNILDNQTLRYRVIDKNGALRDRAYWNIARFIDEWDDIYGG